MLTLSQDMPTVPDPGEVLDQIRKEWPKTKTYPVAIALGFHQNMVAAAKNLSALVKEEQDRISDFLSLQPISREIARYDVPQKVLRIIEKYAEKISQAQKQGALLIELPDLRGDYLFAMREILRNTQAVHEIVSNEPFIASFLIGTVETIKSIVASLVAAVTKVLKALWALFMAALDLVAKLIEFLANLLKTGAEATSGLSQALPYVFWGALILLVGYGGYRIYKSAQAAEA